MKGNHYATTTTAALLSIFAVNAALADAKAIDPLASKDTSAWSLKGNNTEKSKWAVGTSGLEADNPRNIKFTEGGAELVNKAGAGVDIFTKQKFADVTVDLEVMVPKGSNSGIYLMGQYEIQVFDSYGKEKLGGGDMGAIYSAAAPSVNAQKAPGEWNKYHIEFQAPRFDDSGKKIANAKFIKVVLNGQTIHENVEVANSTGGALSGQEVPEGPLMFQGDHGPVAYRNIQITPVK